MNKKNYFKASTNLFFIMATGFTFFLNGCGSSSSDSATSAPFITVWEINTTDKEIIIPTDSNYTYDYNVDWGDEDSDEHVDGNISHTYAAEGYYQVKISGKFPAIYFNDFNASRDNSKQILYIIQWGDNQWKSFLRAFMGCRNLDIFATDVPDLSDVRSMKNMFLNTSFNRNISKWDVSGVTNMSGMFYNNIEFNQPLGNWDVSSVTNMNWMFSGDEYHHTTFDQNISGWDVSSVTDMQEMFLNNTKFNQPLNSWNVSSVTNMSWMFSNTNKFDQPLGNWDVSSVTDMSFMFSGNGLYIMRFNQDISKWDLSNVKDITGMFLFNNNFNQPIEDWDVSSVTDMIYTFNNAARFRDHDLSSWDVANVKYHDDFLTGAGPGNIEPYWP